MLVSKNRNNPSDITKVVMVGETAGVLDGVDTTATLVFKQIKDFILPA